MEFEVEGNNTIAIGNLTSAETDAVFFVLAHLPGFEKDEIEVQIDEGKMEIKVSGGGQTVSFESVNVDGLVSISREVKIERFCRVFSLPDDIIFERVNATFDEEEGILVVSIPKIQREEASTRAVIEQIKEEEDEVSCDGDKEPEPTPLPSESTEPRDRDENLKPTEEFSSKGTEIERIGPQCDQEFAEKDTDFNSVEERGVQESEESDENMKDPPLEEPNDIKLPEITDASFSFAKEEREEQKPETTGSRESKESESKREQEEREPETDQNTESKEPHQNLNHEGEDSDKGSEDTETTMRDRERRRVGKRSPAFPLNGGTSLLARSVFLFSLVVLVFHFLRERRRSRN